MGTKEAARTLQGEEGELSQKVFRGACLCLIAIALAFPGYSLTIPDIKSGMVYPIKNSTIGPGFGVELVEKKSIACNLLVAQDVIAIGVGYLIVPVIEGELGVFYGYDVHEKDKEYGIYASFIKF